MSAETLALRVFHCDVSVRCEDRVARDLLKECYSAFLREQAADSPESFDCHIFRSDGRWVLRWGGESIECLSDADLLYDFEKELTLWLQRCRTDLYFIHAAALSIDGHCVIIAGPSGGGKSSLAWSLCHQGCHYLSDELAPIEPETLLVEAYPHALCLKAQPQDGPSLPVTTIHTSATMHVPAYELACHPLDNPCRLTSLIFIDGDRHGHAFEIATISSGESAARLYSNGLNQLAHPDSGLPAATYISKRVQSFVISGGTVGERSRAILDVANASSGR